VWNASVAVDGDRLWWAAMRRISPAGEYLYKEEIALSATSISGEPIVAPTDVAPDSGSSFDPDVVVTPSAIIAKAGGVETLLRRYDHDGTPLGAAYAVEVRGSGIFNVNDIEMVATTDGGIQLVATVQAETAEAEIIELDANGAVGSRRLAGTPDTTEPGGSSAGTIAAAVRPDGSTLIAWDRNYNACISTRPSATLTTTVDGATIGAVQPVRDLPDSESAPAIATHGAAAYIAWLSFSGQGSKIALARYPDVSTVIAEVGDATAYNQDVRLVLAAPDRGVIAWHVYSTSELHLVPFEDRGSALFLGTPRILATVDTDASAQAAGIVHVGDDRYVVGWIESRFVGLDHPHRLYATELDFGGDAFRSAPPVVPATSVRPRWLRCP
jgi:hypothetical protein